MVIDLSGGTSATTYPVSYLDAVPSGGWSDTYRTTKLVLRRCEAGTFTMDGYGASKSHKVILTRPFYIGIFELTQKQYLQVTGENPSYHVGNMLPVEYMTWLDIRSGSGTFIGRLKKRSGYDSIDLPTEAQWEYAGKGGGKLGGVAASGAPSKVGSKAANGWGIYDMQGNVNEWMLDGYYEYGTGTCTDPMGSDDEVRVIKGGYYGQTGSDACNKIGYRTNDHQSCRHQYTGFRVCVTVK